MKTDQQILNEVLDDILAEVERIELRLNEIKKKRQEEEKG